MVYPNPLSPGHYVLIVHGVPWGDRIDPARRFDTLPDFAIFTHEPAPPTQMNKCLAAGFFDQSWQYSTNLTEFASR